MRPNGGKPDLTLDPQRFVAQMEIVDRYFAPGDCAIAEGVVGDSGYRRLLRFDTVVLNRGDGDLIVGDRSDPGNPYAEYFVYHACHGHFHIKDFSVYELVGLDNVTVVAGTKQGFCFEDNFKYEDGGKSHGYDCENQGITAGWGDWYYKQLVGQWIDITGVPAGDYVVRVTLNSGGIFHEGQDRYPNVTEVTIRVPDPRKKVAIVE
ncbi:MAG: lysyl oxidase family protein [Vicinamibacterales bacterium]